MLKHTYYSYPRTPKTYKYATVYDNVERVIRTIEEELWFIEGIDYTIGHLRAVVPHFTLWVDEKTGTHDVRNVFGTLASWRST